MTRAIVRIICGSLLVSLAGCATMDTPTSSSFFPESEASEVRQVANIQAARGAGWDGTLYATHFTADKLNNLGMDRLRLMLADNATSLPLVVYVALPPEEVQSTLRRQAVTTFLADAGLRPEQFHVAAGYNPATLHRAAPAVAALAKLDGNTATPSDAKPLAAADMLGLPGKK